MRIQRIIANNGLFLLFTPKCKEFAESDTPPEEMDVDALHFDLGGSMLVDATVLTFKLRAGTVSCYALHFEGVSFSLRKELEKGTNFCKIPCYPFFGIIERSDALELFNQMGERAQEIKEVVNDEFDRYDKAMGNLRKSKSVHIPEKKTTEIN
jgi:hypothetical protein